MVEEGGSRILEADYQMELRKKIEEEVLPGSIVQKNDPNDIQGFPDLNVYYKGKTAIIEVKKDAKAPYRPNQEYYLDKFGKDGHYTNTIYPENEEEVLHELQQALQSKITCLPIT